MGAGYGLVRTGNLSVGHWNVPGGVAFVGAGRRSLTYVGDWRAVTEKANPDVAFVGEVRGHDAPVGNLLGLRTVSVDGNEPTKGATDSEKVGVITPDAH